MTKVNQG